MIGGWIDASIATTSKRHGVLCSDLVGDVVLGHRDQASLFLRIHHLDRIAKSAICFRFHLYERDEGPVLGDDVDLAEAGTKAPDEYLIPKALQLEACHLLAFEAQSLSREGHACRTASPVP